MSISFGVAAAGLITALFIPDRFRSNPAEMIYGLHEASLVLGGFTILSTVIFRSLKSEDGARVGKKIFTSGKPSSADGTLAVERLGPGRSFKTRRGDWRSNLQSA